MPRLPIEECVMLSSRLRKVIRADSRVARGTHNTRRWVGRRGSSTNHCGSSTISHCVKACPLTGRRIKHASVSSTAGSEVASTLRLGDEYQVYVTKENEWRHRCRCYFCRKRDELSSNDRIFWRHWFFCSEFCNLAVGWWGDMVATPSRVLWGWLWLRWLPSRLVSLAFLVSERWPIAAPDICSFHEQ